MNTMFSRVFVLSSLILTASACGGGGGGSSGTTVLPTDGSVQALEIGQQVSLVAADDDTTNNLVRSLTALRNLEPTTGDYVTDKTEFYVYDRSMEALDIINEILCYIDKTGYNKPEVVNQGAYKVTFDASQCDRDQDHSSSGTGQSSAQTVDPETWTVKVTRASNTSNQVVNFWIPDEDFGGQLHVKLTITKAAGDDNPFGAFSMDFQSAGEDGVPNTYMYGNLSISETSDGKIDLQFYETGEHGNGEIHAIISPDGSEGQALVARSFMGGGHNGGGDTGAAHNQNFAMSSETSIAFDADHYLADYGDGELECMDKLNFDRFVWQYNLYDGETGDRIELNSGFPVHSGDHWGWAGYYGVWFDEAAGIGHGDVVTDDDDNSYEVFQGAGRLVRRTRNTLDLSELAGDRFSYWNHETFESVTVELQTAAEAGVGGVPANTLVLVQIGSYVCGENGCQFEDSNPVVLSFDENEGVSLWKDGFGNVNLIANADGHFSDDMEVAYYSQEYVLPTDPVLSSGSLQLQCISNCLKPGLSVQDLNNNDPYLEVDWADPEIYVYTFDADDYVLKKDGQNVAIDVGGVVDAGSYYQWGIMSGDMVTTDVNISNDPWSIWQQDVTYFWETGPERWSHLVALKGLDGAFVEFDAELRCLLDHDGDKYVVNYAGEGNLWGIPWVEQEGEDNEFNWMPAFALDNGTEVDCDGETYVTKAMSEMLIMQEDDLSECSDLTVGTVSARTNEFTEPEIGTDPCAETECQTLTQILDGDANI